jgi:hypothetical protein
VQEYLGSVAKKFSAAHNKKAREENNDPFSFALLLSLLISSF